MQWKTPQEIRIELATRARARRLDMNLSQEGLAKRSGVSLGSIKRFERTAHVSLKSLLQISLVLDALGDFDGLFIPRIQAPASIDELLQARKTRRKGRLK